MEKRKIIIIISIVLGIILLTAYIWFLVSTYKKVYPSATDKNEKTTIRQERELGPIEITPEMLESITPPPDAEPIEITPEMLESITPPPDAEPIEITPEMLESITPPSHKNK